MNHNTTVDWNSYFRKVCANGYLRVNATAATDLLFIGALFSLLELLIIGALLALIAHYWRFICVTDLLFIGALLALYWRYFCCGGVNT